MNKKVFRVIVAALFLICIVIGAKNGIIKDCGEVSSKENKQEVYDKGNKDLEESVSTSSTQNGVMTLPYDKESDIDTSPLR